MSSLEQMHRTLAKEAGGDGRARRKWLEAFYVSGIHSPSLETKQACAQILCDNGWLDHSITMLESYLGQHEIAEMVTTFADKNPDHPGCMRENDDGNWEWEFTPAYNYNHMGLEFNIIRECTTIEGIGTHISVDLSIASTEKSKSNGYQTAISITEITSHGMTLNAGPFFAGTEIQDVKVHSKDVNEIMAAAEKLVRASGRSSRFTSYILPAIQKEILLSLHHPQTPRIEVSEAA